MQRARRRGRSVRARVISVALVGTLTLAFAAGTGQAAGSIGKGPKFSDAVAFDVSKPLSQLAQAQNSPTQAPSAAPQGSDGFIVEQSAWSALSLVTGRSASLAPTASLSTLSTTAIPGTIANFEGISNQDNFNLLGGRVNPPDPVGDVGPNHYVEMANLAFAVYSKQGTLLLGPLTLGSLWQNFSVPDCANNAGDPIVVYDQFADRWILSQFTSAGPQYWDCIAVSQTGDPTGAYYRYAFITQPDPDLPGGTFFPDYPKYSVWTDSYILTTRDFGDTSAYGISVYALEKNKLLNGDPKARAVQFFLDGNDPAILPLVGDGLLPADIDGKTKPKVDAPVPIVGTQDDDYVYGATFDALNIFELNVQWNSKPTASFKLAAQLPVAEFDSNFPCGPTRGCIPQPGITDPTSTSTSCRTGSGRRTDSPTGRPRTTRRWWRRSRSRRRRPSLGCGGTRSGARTARTPFTSRERSTPVTASTAGWAPLRWTRRAISLWATASRTRPPSIRESATRDGSRATRWDR